MKILITGCLAWPEKEKNKIEKLGHELIFVQDERIPLREQGIDPSCIEGTICNGLFLHNKVEDFTKLRYVQLTSAGYDRVPLAYMKEHRIQVFNARGVYSVPMAEFAIGGVLQLYKQSRFFTERQRERKWEKHRGLQELFGKTVCIIGCGNVGTECAKRFSVFGCNVLGIDAMKTQDSYFERILPTEQVDLFIKQSDVIILTLPLTEETRHFINQDRLNAMKQGSILVNISRGGTVDTEALIQALQGHLAGAVLDVFEEEPLNEKNPLWEMEHVILTPHNSFVGEGNRKRMQQVIEENLKVYEEERMKR